jgi:Ca2+-binding RTX toxin-like protein
VSYADANGFQMFGSSVDYGNGDAAGAAGISVNLQQIYVDFNGSYSLVSGNAFVDSNGDEGSDKLYSIENIEGTDFNDQIIGDANSNSLAGNDGDDILSGGDENDILYGGNGSDTLTGGSGQDTFKINAADDGQDTITDFSEGDALVIYLQDWYDIYGITAPTGTPANNLERGFLNARVAGNDTIVSIVR